MAFATSARSPPCPSILSEAVPVRSEASYLEAMHPPLARAVDRSPQILDHLSAKDLLSLRLTSRSLLSCAQSRDCHAFQRLYISPRSSVSGRQQCLAGLQEIGKHCLELVFQLDEAADIDPAPVGELFSDSDSITIALDFRTDDGSVRRQQLRYGMVLPDDSERSRRAPSPSTAYTESSDWPRVFSEVPNLRVFTIRPRNKDGRLSTPAAEALTAWRVAFDAADLPGMSSLVVDSLPVSHLPQLRWDGMESFGKASWQAQRSWSRITRLDIALVDPPRTTHPKLVRQGMKVLYSWLGSFADHLEELSFEWIDRRGPNPMTLPQLRRVQLQSPPVQWKRLRVYYFNGERVPI